MMQYTDTNINPEEMYKDALAEKTRGNKIFQSGDYNYASNCYEEAIRLLENLHQLIIASSSKEKTSSHNKAQASNSAPCIIPDVATISSDLSKTHSNHAECRIRLGMYYFAVDQAEKSLKWDKENTKSFFRRAKANVELANYDDAKKDLEYLLEQESKGLLPNSKDVKGLQKEIKDRYLYLYRLIDSYRLRMEDEFVSTGNVQEDTLYSGQCSMPLRHFRAYVRMAMAKSTLPKWFDDLNGNNFDIVSDIAKEDSHYSIRFAVEEADIKEHYKLLDRPNEIGTLRKLAKKIMGPIPTSASFFLDTWDEGDDLTDYYSAHDSDVEDDGNWWQISPYSPFDIDNIITSSPQWQSWVDEKMEKFQSKFNFKPLALLVDKYPRFDFAQYKPDQANENKDDVNVFINALLLERKASGMDATKFCQMVQKFQLIQNKYSGFQERGLTHEDITHPRSKYFDHYGVVSTLAIIAFQLLPEREREDVDIQQRLIMVVFGGEEDVLTPMNFEIDIGGMEWIGPVLSQNIPDSWALGKGSNLMRKAWEIWYSLVRARELLVEWKDNGQQDHILLAKEALMLPCFSDGAILHLRPASSQSVTWDAGLDIMSMYAEMLIHASKAYLSVGDYNEVLTIAEKRLKLDFTNRCARQRLAICTAQAHIGLEQFRDAEACVKYIIDSYGFKSNKDKLPENEIDDLKVILEEIKHKRGPLPEVKPTKIEGKDDWWYYDASINDKLRNHLLKGDFALSKLWSGKTFPNVKKLKLNIHKQYTVKGIKETFPHLEELILDDSEEEIRVHYGLDDLRYFADTLQSLELRLSGQWMNGGDEHLGSMISQLKKLRNLKISHLRDGSCNDLKAFENLVLLETLLYDGRNMCCYNESGGSTLDLSKLTKLKALTFVDCNFCSEGEDNKGVQCLILPDHLKEIELGCDLSTLLCQKMKNNGVRVVNTSWEEVVKRWRNS